VPHQPSVYAREGLLAGDYTGERCDKSAMAASSAAKYLDTVAREISTPRFCSSP
jgi:hypothetical protein